MAELSVACPTCGQAITAPDELELVKRARGHMKEAHDMEVPLEQAQQMVKEMLESRSGE